MTWELRRTPGRVLDEPAPMIPRYLFVAAALLSPLLAPAETQARRDVLGIMERAADWQLANPSKWKPTEWEPAAYYTGVMALAGISASPRFEEAMVKMGEANGWKPGPRPYHADDYCVGQTYVELYLRRHDPKMIAP